MLASWTPATFSGFFCCSSLSPIERDSPSDACVWIRARSASSINNPIIVVFQRLGGSTQGQWTELVTLIKVSTFCLRRLPTTPRATIMAPGCKRWQLWLWWPPLKNENRSGRVVNGENFEGGVALVRYLQQRIDQHMMWLIELSLAIYQGGGTGGKSQLGVRIQAFKHASHNPNKEERSLEGEGRGQFRWDWDVFFVCTSLALSLQLGDRLLHDWIEGRLIKRAHWNRYAINPVKK